MQPAAPEKPPAPALSHWSALEHHSLMRRWRVVCTSSSHAPAAEEAPCTWRSPWFSGATASARATEAGLAHVHR